MANILHKLDPCCVHLSLHWCEAIDRTADQFNILHWNKPPTDPLESCYQTCLTCRNRYTRPSRDMEVNVPFPTTYLYALQRQKVASLQWGWLIYCRTQKIQRCQFVYNNINPWVSFILYDVLPGKWQERSRVLVPDFDIQIRKS